MERRGLGVGVSLVYVSRAHPEASAVGATCDDKELVAPSKMHRQAS